MPPVDVSRKRCTVVRTRRVHMPIAPEIEAERRKAGYTDRPVAEPATLIMCGDAPEPEPCTVCGVEGDYLCDAPVGDGKTCDRVLCDEHRVSSKRVVHLAMDTLDDFDFCPAHAHLTTEIGR